MIFSLLSVRQFYSKFQTSSRFSAALLGGATTLTKTDASSFPQRSCGHHRRHYVTKISPDLEFAAIEGTETWIQDVIVHYGLCPFLTKRKYKIVVSPNDDLDEMRYLAVRHAVQLAAEKPTERLNFPATLVVYPQIDNDSAMEALYRSIIDQSEGLVGGLMDFMPTNDQMKIHAQPFYGEQVLRSMKETPSMAGRPIPIQSAAPYCTIRLLRYVDLDMARGPRGEAGLQVLQQNQRTDQGLGSTDFKLDLLKRCRLGERTADKVVQVTKPLPRPEVDRLAQEGVRVQLLDSPEAAQPPNAQVLKKISRRPNPRPQKKKF